MIPLRAAGAGPALPSALALLVALGLACATPPVAPEPDALAVSGPLGRNFFLRQRIHARFDAPPLDEEASGGSGGSGESRPGREGKSERDLRRSPTQERYFETALQSRCGDLRLVGLSPFGMRLWSATSRDGEIAVESLGGRALPFPPEHVLRDVQRTFFWSPPVAAGASAARTLVRAGESVQETWRDGVLTAREFRPLGAPDSPPVVIRYEGTPGPLGIAPRVTLSNPTFGYALSIENQAIEELSCPDDEK